MTETQVQSEGSNAESSIEIITTVPAETARRVAEGTCILQFYQSEPTFRKKVAALTILNSAVDPGIHDIDPNRLSVSKALIENAELNDLLMNRRRFNRSLKAMSLPGGLLTLAGGQYLIPLTLVDRIKELIDQYVATRVTLLTSFEERYPAIRQRAEEKLGDLFSEDDYPEFELIRQAYTVQYRFVSNAVPEELKKVSDRLYKAEQAKVLAECAGAAVGIEDALTKGFAEVVEHFADRLGVDETTGKPLQLHSSVVNKVKEFVNTFADMNVTGKGDLGALVAQAKELLGDTDADTLRADKDFRLRLQEGFTKIQQSATAMIDTRKRRVILE